MIYGRGLTDSSHLIFLYLTNDNTLLKETTQIKFQFCKMSRKLVQLIKNIILLSFNQILYFYSFHSYKNLSNMNFFLFLKQKLLK